MPSESPAGAPALTDERGCLTPAGLRALAQATPGAAPPELARHVAGCGRCQQRMLSEGRPPRPAGPGAQPSLARLGRNLALVLGALLLALAVLLVLQGRATP